MAQTLGSYDESLLRDAPVATKQQLQEGYTTDLLASKPRSIHRAQSPLPDGATPAIPLRADLEQGQRSQDGFNHFTDKAISNNRTPFWRTTRGIILIVVLVIIIVGVVVGAAVGTTVHSKSSQSIASNSISTTSLSTTASVNPVGGSSPTSATNTTPFPTFGGGAGVGETSPTPRPSPDSANGFAILQSESDAAAMKQAGGHYKRRDTSQFGRH